MTPSRFIVGVCEFRLLFYGKQYWLVFLVNLFKHIIKIILFDQTNDCIEKHHLILNYGIMIKIFIRVTRFIKKYEKM